MAESNEVGFDREHLPKHIRCIPALLAIVAFLLSINGLFCSFVQVILPTALESTGEPLAIHFGYYSHQSWNVTTTSNGTEIQNTCENYPYDLSPPDTTFKVGRTFNLLALILGASFLFLDVLTGCASANQKKSVRQASGVGYMLVTICSGLSLLIFQSTVCTNNAILNQIPAFQGATCSLYLGSKSIIAATVLWFVSACGIIAMHPWSSKAKVNENTKPLLQTIDEEQIMTANL
ncbi:hypothetical protein ACHAXN_013028 [Cyclotella atomus]